MVIVVPYHQDERLPGDLLPVPAAAATRVIDPELPSGDLWTRLSALGEAVAGAVAAVPSPVTVVSGDCLLAVAVLAGAQRAAAQRAAAQPDPALVWLDAHGDVHTRATSTSGYPGGLSLRLALGGDPELVAARLGLRPVPEDRVLLVGARDLDPAEVAFLAASRIRRTTVTGLSAGDAPDGPLVLHVDLDVVDPAELPGLLFPAPGGPPAAEVVAAVRRLRATGRVAVLHIACPWLRVAEPAGRRALLEALLAE
ncbi:arginase family protein [Actinoplanes sp. NPDC051859]|uniref:arginase family protein n=1 Tax=Actinoplanes sp. NPDC051859 TaxID=3363909 RepID=UPI0037A3EEAF